MTITSVSSAFFIADSTILLRDALASNITDPISSQRSGEKFVMTSYPERAAIYPLLTVKLADAGSPRKLGMQSNQQLITLPFEIRVWARNQKEKDELAQSVISYLLTHQFDTGGTIAANLIDFRVVSAVNVDEDGKGAPKSRVLTVEYDFIIGAA